MAKFRKQGEMLRSFNQYMDSRPAMQVYKNKYDMYVPQPPSIVGWAKWLRLIDGWDKIKLKDLYEMSKLQKYSNDWEEINLLIEDDIVNNALIYNYNGNFAQRVLIQKHNWENSNTNQEPVVFVGLDAVKNLLPKEPENENSNETERD